MIVPRNITVLEDDRYVRVNFVLPGYMESCQIYRRIGHYTDVTIHCLHPNSGDVTIYSAHSVLLSAASSYFSFVLVKAFNQLSEMRTSNLKRALRVIKNDNSFQDDSLNFEENCLKFDVQTLQRTNSCNCGCKPSLNTSEVTGNENKSVLKDTNVCQSCNSKVDVSNRTFTVTMRSYISANNVVLVVNGIDPFYIKYVLNCVYSESFIIDKRDINLFLSFIIKIALMNYGVLCELLQPFMENFHPLMFNGISDALNGTKIPAAKRQDDVEISAFNSCKTEDDFVSLNSLYDILQLQSTTNFLQSQIAPNLAVDPFIVNVPLDLSCKLRENCDNQHLSQSNFEVEATSTKDSCYAFTDSLISNALKNNMPNVVFNPEFQNSSCYPYFSNKNISLIDSKNYFNQPLEKTNSIFNIDERESDINAEQNSSLKRKSDVLKMECLPTTSNLNVTLEDDSNSLKSFNSVRKCDSILLKNRPSTSSMFVKKAKRCHSDKNTKRVIMNGDQKDIKLNLFNNYNSRNENSDLLNKLKRCSSLHITRLDVKSPVNNEAQNKIDVKCEKKCNLSCGTIEELDALQEPLLSLSVCTINEQDFNEPNVIVDKKEIKPFAYLRWDEMQASSSSIECLNYPDEYINVLNGLPLGEANTISNEDQIDHIKCFRCDFSSGEYDKMITHIKDSHCTEKMQTAPCVDINCPVQLLFCSKEWEAHIHHHFEDSSYRCAYCSYSTKTKIGVRRHEYTHKSSYKRIAKSLLASTTEKVTLLNKYVPLSCVTRNNRKTYRAIKKGCLKGKIKGGRPNEIKLKNVFATSIFRKLKRGVSARQRFLSSRVYSRICQYLKLPSDTNAKIKAFKSKRDKLKPTAAISSGSMIGEQRLLTLEKYNTDSDDNASESYVDQEINLLRRESKMNKNSNRQGNISKKNKSSNYEGSAARKYNNLLFSVAKKSSTGKDSGVEVKNLSNEKCSNFKEQISDKELNIKRKYLNQCSNLGIKEKRLNVNKNPALKKIKREIINPHENERKEKLFNCSFCPIVLSSYKAVVKHYYLYHSLVLPCKEPRRHCDSSLKIEPIVSLENFEIKKENNNNNSLDGTVISGNVET